MGSNLTAVGFRVTDRESFEALAVMAADRGDWIDVEGGAYVRWQAGAGVEIWSQARDTASVIGMNPFLQSESRFDCRLTARTSSEGVPLDGGFHAWAFDGGSEIYPFVFDVPDARTTDAIELPADATIALAAFAQELTVYDSEADHAAAGSGMAPESVIPSGLFLPGGEARATPIARAILRGRILATETRTNPQTGGAFEWYRVKTLGGLVEIVADPDDVTIATGDRAAPGGIVSGSFWLTGRIVSTRPVRPPG